MHKRYSEETKNLQLISINDKLQLRRFAKNTVSQKYFILVGETVY